MRAIRASEDICIRRGNGKADGVRDVVGIVVGQILAFVVRKNEPLSAVVLIIVVLLA